MNTSANTNKTHSAAKVSARTTPAGFRRRTMAGALLTMGLTASAVGLAATSQADTGVPAPNVGVTAPVPGPVLPWIPTINQFSGGLWGAHCSTQWDGLWHCGW